MSTPFCHPTAENKLAGTIGLFVSFQRSERRLLRLHSPVCADRVLQLANRSHVIWVQPDDCKPVANIVGSFADNPGLAPSIVANNSGQKS